MTLFEHKEAITKWARTAETSEQLGVLQEFISQYLVPRFEKQAKKLSGQEKKNLLYEIQVTKVDLQETIDSRKMILAGGSQPAGSIERTT